jgi:organic radical activating enzyme
MSVINPNKLLISSDFLSVQGEGISAGIPAYFVRLGLCNLSCGMSNKFLNQLVKDKKLEDGEIFVGDLQAEGKATWTCDSTSQWAWRGENKEFQYLIDQWIEQGIHEDICNGTIHVIWTGGEPTIKAHQEAIYNFTNYWYSKHITSSKFDSNVNKGPHNLKFSESSLSLLEIQPSISPYYEIETNGTVVIEDNLFKIIDQINCSPKLSNSGMSVKQRINPDAIKRIMEHSNYQFKFVISTEEDVQEIFRDFIMPFNIPLKNVVCMPGLDDVKNFEERTRFVLEMAKKYKFRGLTRLHIAAWNQVLNK